MAGSLSCPALSYTCLLFELSRETSVFADAFLGQLANTTTIAAGGVDITGS